MAVPTTAQTFPPLGQTVALKNCSRFLGVVVVSSVRAAATRAVCPLTRPKLLLSARPPYTVVISRRIVRACFPRVSYLWRFTNLPVPRRVYPPQSCLSPTTGILQLKEEMASAGTSSPDTHHVQVGDDDDNEDDDGDSSDNDTAVQIDVKIKIPDIFETSRGGNNENDPIPKKVPDHTSGSSGGGDPSDTPPSTAAAAATMVAKAAFRRDDEGDGAGPSPSAASTIADCAVARSLLEMGGTQLQARESREDRRFELSVVTGSPGEVSVGGIKESAGNSSDDGAAGVDGPTATGGFSGIGEVDGIVEGDEDNSILGMTASVSRARRDRDKKKTSRSRESGSLVMDVVKNEDGHEERAGDGNGGLVASGESEAGGQCLTPPTTTTVNGGATWKTNKLPGLDFGAAPGGIVDADGSGSGVNAVSVRRSNGRGNCGVLESEASLVDTFGVI